MQYVADHWLMYKNHRFIIGDTMSSLPQGEGEEVGQARYSLNRLQLEFDQFVLRAIQWILTAHKSVKRLLSETTLVLTALPPPSPLPPSLPLLFPPLPTSLPPLPPSLPPSLPHLFPPSLPQTRGVAVPG